MKEKIDQLIDYGEKKLLSKVNHMGWEEWLSFYHNKYGYDFVVQKIADFPYPWINYSTKEYENFIKKEKYVSQREVFYDEIVFDIDMDDDLPKSLALAEAINIATTLSERLKEKDFSHSVWQSGGKGVHIHMFFPQLFNYNTLDNRLMKKVFIKKMAVGYIRPRDLSGRVQTQTLVTIQIEESKHRKGGVKKMLWDFKTSTPNTLNEEFNNLFIEEVKKNNIIRKVYGSKDKGEKPKIITFLENENFHHYKDGRDRALFILTAYYKQFLNDDELLKKMNDWNKTVLKGYFDDFAVQAKVRSARPCMPMNYAIELIDELGIDKKHVMGD